ncbi:MAG: hypothetical protein AAFY41_00875 [Bacteroidota bacterium]
MQILFQNDHFLTKQNAITSYKYLYPVNPKVDTYFVDGCGRCELYQTPQCKVLSWVEPMENLRSLLLESELKEDYKWSQPCYTLNGKNVMMLGALKDCCFISFF